MASYQFPVRPRPCGEDGQPKRQLPRFKFLEERVVKPKPGYARGMRHPKARLTDEDCELIREAYETGGFSYAVLAEKFDSSKSTIRDVIKCRTRAALPDRLA